MFSQKDEKRRIFFPIKSPPKPRGRGKGGSFSQEKNHPKKRRGGGEGPLRGESLLKNFSNSKIYFPFVGNFNFPFIQNPCKFREKKGGAGAKMRGSLYIWREIFRLGGGGELWICLAQRVFLNFWSYFFFAPFLIAFWGGGEGGLFSFFGKNFHFEHNTRINFFIKKFFYYFSHFLGDFLFSPRGFKKGELFFWNKEVKGFHFWFEKFLGRFLPLIFSYFRSPPLYHGKF